VNRRIGNWVNLTGSPCWTWTQEDLQIDWRVGADWFEVRIAVGPYEMAKDGKGLECDVKEVLKTLKTYNYIQFP